MLEDIYAEPAEETRACEIASLERRIQYAYRMIEERRVAGIDATALETVWYGLLRQYVTLCRRESEAA